MGFQSLAGLLVSLLVFAPSSHAMTKEEFLSAIEAAETALSTVEFSFERLELTRGQQPTGNELFCRGKMLLAGGAAPKYRVDIQNLGRTDKPEKLAYDQFVIADNGTVSLQLLYLGALVDKVEAVPSKPMSLTVRETGGEEDLLTLFETLCPFLPFTHFHSCPGQGKDPICGQRGLSNLLKSAEATWGHAWELSGPDENGVARVTVPMGEPGKVLNVFDIDLSRGGAIVGFAVMGRDGGVFMKMEDLQLQEVEGVWLPASYWLVWDPRVGLSVRFSYQYQSVNRPLTPDDFLFPIPEGVTIYDKITGNSYDSNVPEELRQKLLIESVSEFQQLPEEAPASTPDTRVAEATASPPDGGEQARPGLRWLLLAGSGVFMLIGVVSLGYWAKNRGKRSGQKSPF